MRVSVQNSDPGYFEGSYRCTVYLDGAKLDDCVTADEEEGIAICYDLSEEGKRHASITGDLRTIERRGSVRIETRDEESGVCVLCGAGAAIKHEPQCLRAVKYFADGKEVQPAYVAITLKASDAIPCPECWTTGGEHQAGCATGDAMAALAEDDEDEDEDDRALSEALKTTWPHGGLLGEKGREWVAPTKRPDGIDAPKRGFLSAAVNKMLADGAFAKIAANIGAAIANRAVIQRADEAAREETSKRIIGHNPTRITADELRAAIGSQSVGGTFTDGAGMEVTLTAPVTRRVSDETLADLERLAMKFMCDVREMLDAAEKPKPEDASVHRAIAAMSKPGRANEL